MSSTADRHKHAPLPPSASGRWMRCAPSMAYVRALIDAKIIKKRVSGEAAQKGTRIHTWGEQFVRWMLKGKATTGVKGDADELDQARAYAQFVVDFIQEVGDLYGEVLEYGIEDKGVVSENCWGHRDFWVRTAKWLFVVDLKTGYEEVDPDSSQLKIYAHDIVERFEPDNVSLIIYQPNANQAQPARDKQYTLAEYRREMRAILSAEKASASWFGKPYRRMEAELVAGDHCGWCDALGVCPAARRHAQLISKESFMPVASSKKSVARPAASPPEPSLLTAAQLGEILERADMFQRWLEQVRVRALELIKMNKGVPGWKAVAKRTRYAWNQSATPAQIAKAVGLKPADVVETRTLSPGKVKAKVPKKMHQKLDKLTWRPYDVTIARESDRRPAINSSKLSFQPVALDEEED